MVNDSLSPRQLTPLYCKTGVTVIVATIGESVGLFTVKVGMSPMPLDANPIDGVSLVHS